MKDKSIVGDLINFRGLVYSPINESGVVFLFGKVITDLNMYVEEIKTGFPDCIGRRFTGKGWEKVNIEFEYKSSNFRDHGHNPENCDVIVCWEHDWPECPTEVIELRERIKELPSEPPQRPGVTDEQQKYSLEEHLEKVPPKVRSLFDRFNKKVKTLSDKIWSKVISNGLTYYCPERVFIYLNFQKQGLRLTLFTRGQEIRGIRKGAWTKGGAKWGQLHIKQDENLELALQAAKQSYQIIKQAVKHNESTGWFAGLGEEDQEDGDEPGESAN